jgi:subtilisin family serine protease
MKKINIIGSAGTVLLLSGLVIYGISVRPAPVLIEQDLDHKAVKLKSDSVGRSNINKAAQKAVNQAVQANIVKKNLDINYQAKMPQKNPLQKKYFMLDLPNDPGYSAAQFDVVGAPTAWGVSTGSKNIKVAIIDSGFALNHEDLQAQWYRNLGESGSDKESDGIDNDNNGYIDDFKGWDFSAADNSPQAGEVDPSGQGVSHGTEVSGLIGATGNNGRGSTGVAWNTTLLPLQVLSDDGSGYSNDIVNAIYYAVDQGADVINMSLGTSGDDPVVRIAIDYAINHNVVVVAAAGNCGNSVLGACAGQTTGYVTFPAAYNKVIAVGAVDGMERRAGFSSYGQRIDVVAPGSGFLTAPTWSSTNQTNGYSQQLYGTSFSAPIVSGSAALLRSIDSFTPQETKALLLASSRKTFRTGNLYSSEYGHGILDVGLAASVAMDYHNALNTQPPLLVPAGGIRPEHDVATINLTSVGCQAPAVTWCTVLMQNNALGYDRYLPYKKTNDAGLADWQWTGGLLANGRWDITARQNNRYSPGSSFEVRN